MNSPDDVEHDVISLLQAAQSTVEAKELAGDTTPAMDDATYYKRVLEAETGSNAPALTGIHNPRDAKEAAASPSPQAVEAENTHPTGPGNKGKTPLYKLKNNNNSNNTMQPATGTKRKAATLGTNDEATAGPSAKVAKLTDDSNTATNAVSGTKRKASALDIDEDMDTATAGPSTKAAKLNDATRQTRSNTEIIDDANTGAAAATDTKRMPPPLNIDNGTDAATAGPPEKAIKTENTRPTRASTKGKAPAYDMTNDADDADETAANEPASDDDSTTRNGKAKASTTAGFTGQSSGNGTSLNKPDGAPLDVPWHCANRSCTSGQTWHERDGTANKAHGRKVISNFFGRNKKETNYIDADVWHNYCRKDYQRGTYRVEKGDDDTARAQYYINNIELQLTRLRLWRPEARFKTQLTGGASKRLNAYYGELRRNGGDVSAAEAAVHVTPATGKKGVAKPLKLEDAFPVKYLDEFSTRFCGEDFTYDDLGTTMVWVQGLVNSGEITTMPPMEFLINQEEDGEAGVTDPSENYDRWMAHEDGKVFGQVDPNDPGEGPAPKEDVAEEATEEAAEEEEEVAEEASEEE